jgi:L-fuculose-phosphate aldolase
MITAMCDVMKRLYERGWITTRDGNASLRRKGSNIIYITPSGVRKNVLRVEDIIKMKVDGNNLVIPDGSKPSGELHMHKLIQLHDNSSTRVVVHAHPTHIIAALYAGWSLQEIAAQFIELSRYTKVGPDVPIIPAVSEELGESTYRNLMLTGSDIVAQALHGVCVVGSNPWECYEHIERADHVCEIVLKSGVKR